MKWKAASFSGSSILVARMCNILSSWPIAGQDQGDKQELSSVKQKWKDKVILLYPAGPFFLGCYSMRAFFFKFAHTYVREESCALLLFPSSVFLVDLTT